jgi:hypothetical protein
VFAAASAMPIAYTVDRDRHMITETWTGPVDAEYLGSYWERYLKDPDVMAIRRTVVDLRQGELHFTGPQLHALIERIVVPALNGRDWKSALVVEKPAQFGVCRQYQVFADLYSQDAIFFNLDEAYAWLIGPK